MNLVSIPQYPLLINSKINDYEAQRIRRAVYKQIKKNEIHFFHKHEVMRVFEDKFHKSLTNTEHYYVLYNSTFDFDFSTYYTDSTQRLHLQVTSKSTGKVVYESENIVPSVWLKEELSRYMILEFLLFKKVKIIN